MKFHKNLLFTALTLLALPAGAWAQTAIASNATPAKADPPAAPPLPPTVTAADIQSLRDALAAQQLQIERLTQQLERQQAWQQAQQAAGKSDWASQPAPQPVAVAAAGDVAPQNGAEPVPSEQQAQPNSPLLETQPNSGPLEGPLTIHFRGINLTPGG